MKKETFHVISNTHWDREWYQSHENYLVRLIELTDRLIDIMEKKPSYRFITDGQYALVEDYLTARPENTERVKALVEQKRLLIGPWYTQPLENIVGGEALVRNLQKGISDSEKLGGAMRFSYEIDEFGHTSQLPQILAGFGINDVMAWRGVPPECKSCFRWTGPDGTSAWFFNSNAGYGEATGLPGNEEDYTEIIDGTPLEREGLKTHVNRIYELRRKVSDSDNMLWLNGIDHSWAQEDILEICEKIEKLFPEYTVRQSIPEEYAEAVKADLKEKGAEIPEAKGELMFTAEPVLESTNALHPTQKRRHYETEKLLVREVEPLTEAAALLGCKYPRWAIDREWKYVLENHAHDSLGCCSVDEVYEQVMARYGASLSIGSQLRQDALRYIMSCSEKEPSLWLFNLSGTAFRGSAKLVFDIPEGFGGENVEFSTPDGKKVEMSVISSEMQGDVRYNPHFGHPTWGRVCHFEAITDCPEIPAFGCTRLVINKIQPDSTPGNRQNYYFSPLPNVLENDNLKIVVNTNGTIDLTDKVNGNSFTGGMLFTDDGESANCYVHEEPVNDTRRFTSHGCNASICTVYDTPLGAEVKVSLCMEIPSGITQDRKRRTDNLEKLDISYTLTLTKDSRSVDVAIHTVNRSKNHRLRVLFPTGLEKVMKSESGQAYDEVERDICVPEIKLPELPYMTHPMQDYCAVADGDKGLGIAARGIYEYECTDTKDRALAITLLRCIEVIDNQTFQTTPQYFMEKSQNIGELDFALSIIPYNAEREELLKEVASVLCKPVAAANRDTEDSVMPGYVRPENILGDKASFLALSGDGLCVESFKRAYKSDSLIVRVRNRLASDVDGSLEITLPGVSFTSVYETDLEEKRINKIGECKKVTFTAGAKKVLTFEFE